MANYIKRPNGTEDVTPAQIHKWKTVETVVRQTAESFGFSEIRVPTFEATELFQRSVGETTDVVQKEMYSVIAKETQFTLRPEGTAGTIRAMLQNGMLAEALPQKAVHSSAAHSSRLRNLFMGGSLLFSFSVWVTGLSLVLL